MANNPHGHVGLFNKRGVDFKIHQGGCGMLNTASRHMAAVPADDNEIDDLLEREFKVSYCRCVPKGQRRKLAIGERTAS